MIQRRNILELIGKNTGKYRNCILTCYSLDFSFFEERVLPILKTANIKNVNVFADGKFLELAQEHTTGREFGHNKTYNFHPIYSIGVFHPKIMLLTGPKHGLLIIGSGNITSSGLNTNDEIWGAFHLNDIKNENCPLFAEAWSYLQQFLKQVKGFAQQKIDWIIKSSPWLQELTMPVEPIILKSQSETIYFVHNNSQESISDQLIKIVPDEDLLNLTIISPYYDLNGEIISALYNSFNPRTLNCVLDVNYGIIPKNMDTSLKEIIKFFDWKDCKNDYEEHFNRLHAKLIHFEFSDGQEYLLLGSPNSTVAAFGIAGRKAVNTEAGVILKRNKKASNWLKELGIILPSNKAIDIDSLEGNDSSSVSRLPNKKYLARIIYSELRGNEIHIYLLDNKISEGYVLTFSNQHIELESIPLSYQDGKILIECSYPDEIFKICITDFQGNAITNFNLVHRVAYLLKCNPDPEQEKLNNLLEQDFPEGEGYSEMLQYVDYNWADEEENIHYTGNRYANAKVELSAELKTKYQVLSATEFNKISDEILLRQSGELNNSSVRIADFLNAVASSSFNRENDFEESEEQKLYEDSEQRGEGGAINDSVKIKISAEKEKAAIETYFRKLDTHYLSILRNFYSSKALTQFPNEHISIKNLSNILIAVQLILLYWNKRFTIEKADIDDENLVVEGTYLEEGDLYTPVTSVKGFILDVFGKFLIISSGRFNEYPYEILAKKMFANRSLLFIKSILIILKLTWIEREHDYRNILLLNNLYFLNAEDVNNDQIIDNWKDQLNRLVNKIPIRSDSYPNNFNFLFDNLIPKYRKWLLIFKNPETKNKVITNLDKHICEHYIFNSKIGFNAVSKYTTSNGKHFLTLKRSGYPWNEEKDGSFIEDLVFGNKVVLYK